MFNITIKGEAYTEYTNLSKLNGISCEDEFSEYFGKEEQCLIDKNVSNGYLQFSYENDKLWSMTTYDASEKLTDEELRILSDYTQGQWSDGIGEGFEQRECFYDENDGPVYVSAWNNGQIITAEQVEIENDFDFDETVKKVHKKLEKENNIKELNDRLVTLIKEGEELIKSLTNRDK